MPKTSVRRPAPTACTGVRPTTSMKNGLKKSAPDTPEPIATVENTMDAGKTHHNCENVYIEFARLLRVTVHHHSFPTLPRRATSFGSARQRPRSFDSESVRCSHLLLATARIEPSRDVGQLVGQALLAVASFHYWHVPDMR